MTIPHPTAHPHGDGQAIRSGQTELQLDHGNHLRLRASRDMRLSTVRGIAWITLEMEAGESVVSPGDAFIISSGKTALVGPLHQSVTLELCAVPAAPAASRTKPSILRRLLRLDHGLGLDLVR